MPRTTVTVSVFLASPMDVNPERDIVARTISEWNQIRGRSSGVYFDLLRWETTVASGISSDGQAVVNEQIADYDILIALFWTRIGTRTPRADSGTIEEYEIALKNRQSGEDIEIAFYFKDKPVSPASIDVSQLSAVISLRDRAAADGVFHKSFDDDNSLRFEVDLLLDKLASRFSEQASPTDGPKHLPTSSSRILDTAEAASSDIYGSSGDDDGRGIYEVNEDLADHVASASSFLGEMVTRLGNMTTETSEVTLELREQSQLGQVHTPKTKSLINRVADAMTSFSKFTDMRLPDFLENNSLIAQDIVMLVSLARDAQLEDSTKQILITSLTELKNALGSTIESIDGMVAQVRILPRMTTVFNKSRLRLVTGVSTLTESLSSSFEVISRALEELSFTTPPPPVKPR